MRSPVLSRDVLRVSVAAHRNDTFIRIGITRNAILGAPLL